MYISSKASRIRQREAQKARDNRAEIVKALSIGQISRRDLFKWGLLTTTGLLVCKNGLSPFARSAFADVPTGTPRSPLFGATKFSQRMPRLNVQQPIPLTRNAASEAVFPTAMDERPAKRLSYHDDFTVYKNDHPNEPIESNPFRNPITNRGPMEGRPPGEFFAHQRWEEYFPKVGYVLSWAQCAQPGSAASATGTRFHPNMVPQNPDAVWCYGTGKTLVGRMAPPLIKGRYGEPILTRIYNNTPVAREENGGFGRNETQLHFHNAHNAAESDGATGAHHFPGTFYDYLWGTTLARADKINKDGTDAKASGPNDSSDVVMVPGDWREIQGTMWAHDHRFFFTAENVYKGNLMQVNYYSGRDRGHETITAGNNLRLPSGTMLPWGNVDFDVNLMLSDGATDRNGQYFYDIFTTDGFLGDLPLVNFAYAPYFEVLPRKYRFRLLNACMSRFFQLAVTWGSSAIPIQVIANDGNLLVNPVRVTELDAMGSAERFDIIVDFSNIPVGNRLYLVNMMRMRDNGRGPKEKLSLSKALGGYKDDPVIGKMLEFRVVNSVPSVDAPGTTLNVQNSCGSNDKSQVPAVLTEQIPIVAPVRTRMVEFGRSGSGDSRDRATGECTPDCPEGMPFPWTVRINGESAHSFNANRISMLVPKPGEVEHWTYKNTGDGWDHPIHLHFEEGITIARSPYTMPSTEYMARKDVWRLREQGSVTFQVQFGEFGGSYVNHCHNTVHEDFAMLLRYQVLASRGVQVGATPTPHPTPDGVYFTAPDILPEGNPTKSET
jgi:FtsP/CotA-like multicopper oxidase with cupredoxin domain